MAPSIQNSRPTNDRRGALQLVGVACLVVCVLFAAFSIPFFWGQIRVLQSWPVRQAQVIHSDVVTTPSGYDQLYSTRIQIAFVADDRPITTELITSQSSNYEETARSAAEFPVGSRHAIRYDPRQPTQVRIAAGWNLRFFAVPLITLTCGAFFGVFGAGFIISARASDRR